MGSECPMNVTDKCCWSFMRFNRWNPWPHERNNSKFSTYLTVTRFLKKRLRQRYWYTPQSTHLRHLFKRTKQKIPICTVTYASEQLQQWRGHLPEWRRHLPGVGPRCKSYRNAPITHHLLQCNVHELFTQFSQYRSWNRALQRLLLEQRQT